MDEFIQKYNVDRKAASRLLKISVRTVDRYIKKKVLTAQNIGGRVWLNKDEVETLNTRHVFPQAVSTESDTNIDTSTSVMTIDTTHDNYEKNQPELSTQGVAKTVKSADLSPLYQNLYNEVKEELKEKQERLEIANYRVGQLEAQIKNSVPLLEYHREAAEKKLEKARLIEKLENTEKQILSYVRQLQLEKYNKKIFLAILLILMALQPLWLFLLSK